MRYSLLLHYAEAGAADLSEDEMAQWMSAFDDYAKALEGAGVLLAADVLQPSTASTTVRLRDGALQVQDGPFADTKEQLGGVFVVDMPDLDAALAWAERCPAAQWGAIEVRPAALFFGEGRWNPAT